MEYYVAISEKGEAYWTICENQKPNQTICKFKTEEEAKELTELINKNKYEK